MSLSLNIESLADILPSMIPLLESHYEEIAMYKDKIKLSPDYEAYLKMEKDGMCITYTVRDDGKLVGYCVVFLIKHLHYKEDVYAHIDITYMEPAYRGKMAGVKLFKFVEDDLSCRNVSVIIQHTKVSHNFGGMLERLGYEKAEIIYSKCIKGE